MESFQVSLRLLFAYEVLLARPEGMASTQAWKTYQKNLRDSPSPKLEECVR